MLQSILQADIFVIEFNIDYERLKYNMKKVILASQSPRRRELMGLLGLDFSVMVDNTPEHIDASLSPDEVVCTLAGFKGENVAKTLSVGDDAIIIAADTVVAADGKILGKPANENEAEKMLLFLSDRRHDVYTGVYIKDTARGKSISFYEKTEVFFRKLDTEEIKGYINTREPMDKAGAYGIQGFGALFVEKINGDYFNVVGLPVCKLAERLKKDFGFKII